MMKSVCVCVPASFWEIRISLRLTVALVPHVRAKHSSLCVSCKLLTVLDKQFPDFLPSIVHVCQAGQLSPIDFGFHNWYSLVRRFTVVTKRRHVPLSCCYICSCSLRYCESFSLSLTAPVSLSCFHEHQRKEGCSLTHTGVLKLMDS